jgi:peptidoglycan hydrolase-like protein with peptidoglycan-binding domain
MSHPFRTLAGTALLSLLLATGGASAQTLLDVAQAAATVDRGDPDAVRSVQTALRDLGFYTGPIDGLFGAETYRAAVAAVAAASGEASAPAPDTALAADAGEDSGAGAQGGNAVAVWGGTASVATASGDAFASVSASWSGGASVSVGSASVSATAEPGSSYFESAISYD